MTQTILLLTYGSRGDVEPYLALALGLKEAGYRPVLATSSRFQSWITQFGIEVYPLSDALLALIKTDAGKSMIEGTQGLWTRLKSGIELTRKSGPLNADLVQNCWQAAQDTHPDLIVFHPKAFAAPHIAAYPVLHAISPALMRRPSDWVPQAEMTGFWYMPNSETPLSHELETLITAGDKPVFIGFGSMVSNSLSRLIRTNCAEAARNS